MGTDKALLQYKENTFLENAISEFADEKPVLVSVGKGRRYMKEDDRIRYVEDRFDSLGPLGALEAVLDVCETEALFVSAVDMPFADREMKFRLLSFLRPGIDAVVPVSKNGRIHPLCAVYGKHVHEAVLLRLKEGQYRVQDFLQKIRVCYVPSDMLADGERKLSNINTPEEYAEKCRGIQKCKAFMTNAKNIPILAVAAFSGTGKTTFLEKLIRKLTAEGMKIAVLKHDGHDFEADKEGKDTWRFAKAGARQVILLSDTKTVSWNYHHRDVMPVINSVEDADLILIEGLKQWDFPKILLFRKASQKPPAMDPKTDMPVMIVSDVSNWPGVNCPILGLDEIEKAAYYCRKYAKGEII